MSRRTIAGWVVAAWRVTRARRRAALWIALVGAVGVLGRALAADQERRYLPLVNPAPVAALPAVADLVPAPGYGDPRTGLCLGGADMSSARAEDGQVYWAASCTFPDGRFGVAVFRVVRAGEPSEPVTLRRFLTGRGDLSLIDGRLMLTGSNGNRIVLQQVLP